MARSTYPDWIFDGSAIADPLGRGERAVRWLRMLRHPKSTLPGRPFQLDPWQERIVRAIYGPRHDDGTRIVKSVVLLLPRGNRKTSLAAALALLHTIGPERVPGGEVISAAADRKQARLAYAEALGIVRTVPQAASNTRVVDFDVARRKVKVAPIAKWTEAEQLAYIERYDIPVNPLLKDGYRSVGCWPCTRRTAPGEDPRAGRWAAFDKTECGLHV